MSGGIDLSKHNLIVKHATLNDKGRWFNFVSTVQADFCGINLVDDEKFRSGMLKNMRRGTAIYIEDASIDNTPIIGGLTFSSNQNHISWLAVNANYRRKGVASLLMNYALCQLFAADEIKVKTFL